MKRIAVALSLLASIVAAHADELTLKTFRELLEGAGYRITGGGDTSRPGAKTGWIGGVQYNATHPRYVGARQLNLDLQGNDDTAVDDLKLLRVHTTVEFRTAKPLPVVGRLKLTPSPEQGLTVVFVPHVGSTMSAMTTFDHDPSLDSKKALALVEASWKSVDEYARMLGSGFVPVDFLGKESFRIDERQVVAYPDMTSLERLVDHWGWHRAPWGGSSGIPPIYAKFGRYEGLVTCVAFEGDPTRRELWVTVYLQDAAPNAMAWVDRYGDRYNDVRFGVGGLRNSIECIGTVRLGPKTTALDIKAGILAFLGRAEALEREIRNGIVPPPKKP